MRILFILVLIISGHFVHAAEADQRCRESAALALKSSKSEGYTAKDVETFAATLAREGCDEGVYAEQATEVITNALINDFSGVLSFGNSGETPRIFILRHINTSAAESDLVLIMKKRGYCFVANSKLCQDVIAAAEKSLQNMYKKSRSFDRKPAASSSR